MTDSAIDMSAFGNFEEAILESISISAFQTRVDVVLDYTWSVPWPGPGDRPVRRVHATMKGVRLLLVENSLPDHVYSQPDLLGWSHNEVAMATITVSSVDPTLKEFTLLWESEQRILIRASSIELIDLGESAWGGDPGWSADLA